MQRLLKRITLYWSLVVIVIPLLTLMGPAPAVGDTTWQVGTGSWITGDNWNNGLPAADTDAFISNGGTANIASGDSAVAHSLTIADYVSSTGTVTQNGGTLNLYGADPPNNVLRLGLTSTASGFYNLLGGSLSTQQVCVGDSGYGEFLQAANTEHQVAQQLTIGQSTGGVGKYTLDGGTLQTGVTMVGYDGTGTFDHKAGTHSAGAVNVGHNTTGGQGTYNLDGGNLVSQGLSINGEFKQTSGTSTNEGWLMLSANPGGVATYSLVDGTLVTGNEHIGGSGTSTFTQTGGEHRVTNSTPGQGLRLAGGSFNLEGGTLNAQYVSLGSGTFTQLATTTNTIGGMTISTTDTGESKYSLKGGILNSNNVTVGYIGHGEFVQDPDSTHNVAIGMGIGQSPSGAGQYTMTGGSLSLASLATLTLGSQGTGTFTQTGGNVSWAPYWDPSTNASNALIIGQNGGTGTYNLQGTGTLTMDGREFVGSSNGKGAFIQSGGTNSVTRTLEGDYGRLIVGWNNSVGTYQLSGGLLTVDGNELLGTTNTTTGGTGHFIQSGGTNDIKKTIVGGDGGRLLVGWSYSNGTYELNDGDLKVDGKEILGGRDNSTQTSGTGSFIQSGGTNIITGTTLNDKVGRLIVGWYDNSVGTYNLSGGQFTADRIVLGDNDKQPDDQPLSSGQGTLNITGPGNLVVRELFVGLAAAAGNDGFGKLNLASQDAYVEVKESFEIGPQGIFTAVEGATIHMTGTDFIVTSTNSENLKDLKNLKLIFTGGPGVTDTFEVPFEVGSVEVGPDSHVQFVDNCNITNLILDPGALLDFIDNDGDPGDGVITVTNLFLKDGAELSAILDQQEIDNLQYQTISNITSPVPIPGSLLLLGTGLLGLGAVGWRRRRG